MLCSENCCKAAFHTHGRGMLRWDPPSSWAERFLSVTSRQMASFLHMLSGMVSLLSRLPGFGKAHFLAWAWRQRMRCEGGILSSCLCLWCLHRGQALPSWRLLPLAPWCPGPLCQSLLGALLQTVPTYASFLCKFRIQNQTARLLPF